MLRFSLMKNVFGLVLLMLMTAGTAFGQTPNGYLDFGTSAVTTATTGTTGLGGIRVGTGNGGFSQQTPGQSIGAGAELRAIAPTATSINSAGITSAEYGTAANVFTISFETYLSGGASGIWYFFAGNGTSFAATQSSGFAGGDVFTGLRWTFGLSNTIATDNRAGSAWTAMSGTPFAQNTAYYVTIIGNNSTATVSYGAGNAYSVAANKYDLWVNGVLVGDDVAKGGIGASTTINAFRFYAESSAGNVATLALDNIRWYNTAVLPPTHLALVSVPSTGSVSTNLTSYTAEVRSGSATGPIASAFTGAVTVSKVSGSGNISGTLSPNAVAGVATYANTKFDAAATYTIKATAAAPIVDAATSGNIVITSPVSITPSPTSYDFGSIPVNGNDVKTFTITNVGLSAAVNVTGGTTNFQVSSDGTTYGSTATIAQGGGTLYVKFLPTAASTYGPTAINLASGATTSSVSVQGKGASIVPDATTYDFGTVTIGATPVKTFVVTNTNLLTTVSVTGGSSDFQISSNGTTYGTTASIAQGGGTLYVKFIPTAAISYGPTVLSLSSAVTTGNATASITVQGTGATPTLPTITFTPTTPSLTFATTGVGYNSAEQNYGITGVNLTDNITVTAPAGFLVSTTSGSGYTGSVTYTQSGGNVSSTVYVISKPVATGAYSGNIGNASTGATTQNVAVNGIGGTPIITTTPTSLAFGTVGVSFTSAQQSFTVSGSYLTANLTLTAPTGYAISTTSGSGYAGTVSLTPNATTGALASTTVYVVFQPTAATTYNSGSITNSLSLTAQNVALTGTGSGPSLTYAPTSVAFGTVGVSFTSTQSTVNVSGTYFTSNVTLTAPAGFAISTTSGSGYGNSVTLTPNLTTGVLASTPIYLVFQPTAATTYSANVTNNVTSQNLPLTGTGAAPTITTTPHTLALGTTGVGYTSAEQTFTVSGSYLTANLVLTAPTGYAISTTTGTGYGSSVTLTPNATTGALASTTIYVVFQPTATGANPGNITNSLSLTAQNVALTGTGGTPTVTLSSTATLTFTANVGATSAQQSYTVSATYLTANLVLTAPTNFGISTTTGTGYGSTITLTRNSTTGAVASTTIYVVFQPTASGAASGNITHASTGATAVNKPVSGTGTPACVAPSQATALSFGTITGSSIAGGFTTSSATGYLVVVSTSNTLSATPTDGTTYSSGSFGGGTVVQSGTGISFTATGLSQTTPYYFFVFAYNSTSCFGGPVYKTPALTGTATTANAPSTIAMYSFAGADGDEATFPADLPNPAGITAGVMSRGSGISSVGGVTSPDVLVATGWTTANTLNATDYFQFIVTPNSGASMNLTNFAFDDRSSATGVQNWSVYYSTDGFASSNILLGSGSISGTGTQNESIAISVSGLTGATTFRIYGYNAGAAAGTYRIDNVTVSGYIITQPTITLAPTSLAFGSVLTNSTSVEKTFTITGTGLTTTPVTITAPANFEVSTTTGTGFGGTASVTPSSANLSQTIYVRFKPTANTAYSGNVAVVGGGVVTAQNVAVTGTGVPACVAPNQATALIFGTSTTTTIPGSFTAASGGADGYLVLYSTSANLSTGPVDGVTYTAGSTLGGGTVIQSSSALSFTATSLAQGTPYYFFVYAYTSNSTCAGGPVYKKPVLDNSSATLTPACVAPANQATALTFPTVTPTSISGSFTSATSGASGYLVVRSTSGTFTGAPATGTIYNAGDLLGGGTVVQSAAGTTFTTASLTQGTPYYFYIFAYNNTGCTGGPLYRTGPLTGNVTTPIACTTPLTQATALVLNGITSQQVNGSFTASATADNYLVVRSTSSTLSASPVDGTSYLAGASFGGGTVVQSSAATTFTASSLTQSTHYYFFVFAYKNTGCYGGPLYKTPALTNDATTLGSPYSAFDNFDRADNSTVGVPSSTPGVAWAETELASTRAVIYGNKLVLRGGSGAGQEIVSYDMTNKYVTTFNNAPSDLVWVYNMASSRTTPSGFNSSLYGSAFILGATTSDFANTGSGYAVILGNQGAPDYLKIVRYTGGIVNANNVFTDIATYTTTDFENDILNIRVEYSPITKIWKLYVNAPGTTASAGVTGVQPAFTFADPTTVTYGTPAISAADNSTLLSSALQYSGCYWQHQSNTANDEYLAFDNLNVPNVQLCTINTWTGATSTDWFTASNWSCGTVPTSSTNVSIPSGLVNYPVVGSIAGVSATAANVAIGTTGTGAQASVTVQSNVVLEIYGNLTNSGAASFGGGKVTFKGTAATAQTIAGVSTFQDLEMNGTGITLTSGTTNKVKVKGVLNLKAGAFTTANNLTIGSDANGTGLVDNFTTGNLGTLTGNLTVERYVLNTNTSFYYIGAPVGGANITDWSADFGNTPMNGATNGSHVIPQPSCTPTALAMGSPYGGLFEYIEGQVTNCNLQGWNTQFSGAITPGKGFAARAGSGTIIDLTGSFNNGDVISPAVTGSVTNTTTSIGFNLVANPYAAPIDWALIAAGTGNGNIDGTAYIYQNAGQFVGGYLSVNSVSGNREIGSSEAFFVHVSPGVSTNVTFKGTMRKNGTNIFLKTERPYDQKLTLDISGNGFADRAIMAFGSNFTAAFDREFDAIKMINDEGHPNLYVTDGTDKLAIYAQPSITEAQHVPVAFTPGVSGTFTIKATDLGTFDANTTIILEDLKLHTTQDLVANSTYTFTAQENDNAERFMVHFAPANKTTGIGTSTEKATIITANGNDIAILFGSNLPSTVSMDVMDLMGRKVIATTNIDANQNRYDVHMDNIAAGCYFVRIVGEGYNKTEKVILGNVK